MIRDQDIKGSEQPNIGDIVEVAGSRGPIQMKVVLLNEDGEQPGEPGYHGLYLEQVSGSRTLRIMLSAAKITRIVERANPAPSEREKLSEQIRLAVCSCRDHYPEDLGENDHSIACDERFRRVKLVIANYNANTIPTSVTSQADALQDEERAHEHTIAERDRAEEWADRLAGAISEFTSVDIGEHSNLNRPWVNALDAIESQQSVEETRQDGERSAWLELKGGQGFYTNKSGCREVHVDYIEERLAQLNHDNEKRKS